MVICLGIPLASCVRLDPAIAPSRTLLGGRGTATRSAARTGWRRRTRPARLSQTPASAGVRASRAAAILVRHGLERHRLARRLLHLDAAGERANDQVTEVWKDPNVYGRPTTPPGLTAAPPIGGVTGPPWARVRRSAWAHARAAVGRLPSARIAADEDAATDPQRERRPSRRALAVGIASPAPTALRRPGPARPRAPLQRIWRRGGRRSSRRPGSGARQLRLQRRPAVPQGSPGPSAGSAPCPSWCWVAAGPQTPSSPATRRPSLRAAYPWLLQPCCRSAIPVAASEAFTPPVQGPPSPRRGRSLASSAVILCHRTSRLPSMSARESSGRAGTNSSSAVERALPTTD